MFNAILAAFGVMTLTFGDWRDALFLGVLLVNTGIGITQEARAKRALDRLAALVVPDRPRAARRAGAEPWVARLVTGDLVRLLSGDQVVADGRLVQGAGLMLDEAILTGRVPARRAGFRRLRSGQARSPSRDRSLRGRGGRPGELRRAARGARTGIRAPAVSPRTRLQPPAAPAVAVMLPLAAILGYSLWARETATREAVTTSTAAVVSLVRRA